ncbi:MAG: GntR family transcriptional regulator [Butyricicoccaceae bacterium]
MIRLDYRDSRPVYEQIADKLEMLAMCGALEPEEQLPSVRQLATELSINPNTVQKAYGELLSRGVIYSVKGRGNFISDSVEELRERKLTDIRKQIELLLKQARELGMTDEELRHMLRSLSGGEEQ